MLALATPAIAQFEEDDDEYPPGVLARYSSGGKTITRVEPDIAFDWGKSPPDPRLSAGPFTAEWTGQLLVRQAGAYRFHVFAAGDVKVEIDGQVVLDATAAKPRWFSGSDLSLGFGEKPLRVTYRSAPGEARVGLYWSSDAFYIEPVPAHRLFRDESDSVLENIERGRMLFDAHRCNRCHRRKNDPPSPPAADLSHVRGSLTKRWLIEKIQRPEKDAPYAKMPAFGFSDAEARAIAEFLSAASGPVELPELPAVKKQKDQPAPTAQQERRQGEVLFRSIGCLACHTVGKLGEQDPYGGGDLSHVGNKRTIEWLAEWLKNPERLNHDHRMPVFSLSPEERRSIAHYLSGLRLADSEEESEGKPNDGGSEKAKETSREALIDEGKSLFKAARCTACHRIEGVESEFNELPDLSRPVRNWNASCLAESVDRTKNRPSFSIAEREPLVAFIESRTGRLAPPSRFDVGKHVLQRRSCTACHERDLEKGIVATAGRVARVDDELTGQSQSLIPPALTAVGDKLLDESLARAVSGEQKQRRLPWLRVRMPKFSHSEDDKKALLEHLVAHDRIPDSAPGRIADSGLTATDSAQLLVDAHAMVGAKGFSCIACHQIGEYKPGKVAPGTRGSDLLMLGKRMRKEYYARWTRSPMRIVPGMEMPSYIKPLPGVLDENIDAQLAATWAALNDPRFKAPTNPSVVEQFLVVGPEDPARVVRDVFTNPKENGGGAIARALAVGLNNGHNLLFDLDVMAVRQWTIGDFARQRAIGKSWYWDMAGVPVVSGFMATSDFVLVPKSGDAGAGAIKPFDQHGTNGRLSGYHPVEDGIEFRYRIDFEIGEGVVPISVTERIQPANSSPGDKRSGWDRSISVEDVPDGYDVLVATPESAAKSATVSIAPGEHDRPNGPTPRLESVTGFESKIFFRIQSENETSGAIVLRYRSELVPDRLQLNKPEPKPAPPIETVTSTPGFDGIRLPIDGKIMPTAITWTREGTLAFTSLKGHVFLAHDTDGDGIEDELTVFEDGLAAPFGIVADGNDLIVAHKPELLRLSDTDGDGRADVRTVLATGWGFTDNYHDWTTGIVRDSSGRLYVGLGSDYAQRKRPLEKSRWRGKVLRVETSGAITPIGHAFRYPTGLAIDAGDRVFVTDNQGNQNTFNEVNHLVPSRHYGVPSRHEEEREAESFPPAVQLPHPLTRSVNGIFFLPDDAAFGPLAGHGIGCEYDSRFLIRFSTEQVDGVMQGAMYYLSRPNAGSGGDNFIGPLCGAVSPQGVVYIGSIHDSGWLGGQNTGGITCLAPNGKLPNGIKELRAAHDGFIIEFIEPFDRGQAALPGNYTISGYTRKWKGGYATPDSGRYKVSVTSVDVSDDAHTVRLHVDRLRTGYVYEVSCGRIDASSEKPLWPATGHYTMLRIPGGATKKEK